MYRVAYEHRDFFGKMTLPRLSFFKCTFYHTYTLNLYTNVYQACRIFFVIISCPPNY